MLEHCRKTSRPVKVTSRLVHAPALLSLLKKYEKKEMILKKEKVPREPEIQTGVCHERNASGHQDPPQLP
jgi:hypothetical protein